MFEDSRKRWLALYVLCFGVLMIVLDTTIVNVALPSIREDLQLHRDLAGVGRQRLHADLRRLPAARRAARRPVRPPQAVPARAHRCSRWHRWPAGSRSSQGMLIAARAVQGLGGAVVSAVALSLIMNLFTETGRTRQGDGHLRLRLLGGGSIGVLLGGLLTTSAQLALDLPRQPADRRRGLCAVPCAAAAGPRHRRGAKLDIAGAITVTASLMLAVYAIVNGNEVGWTSPQTLCDARRGGRAAGRVPRHRVARARIR